MQKIIAMRILSVILTFLLILFNWVCWPQTKSPFKGRDLKRFRMVCIVNACISGMLAAISIEKYSIDYFVLECLVLVVINPLIIRMLKNLKGKKRTQV